MEAPIVQFSASIQYALEGAVTKIDVMRIGALDQSCVVRYMPLGNELEGITFHSCRGELEFGPGDHTKTFDLRLIDEKTHDSVVELPFKLEAVSNCEVGKYNNMTRIKVIDDDVFPSAKFKVQILADPTCDTWKDGKDWPMLWEIVKLCYSINRWGATKILLGDQIINLIFIMQLELNKILINALSNTQHGFHTREGILLFAIALTAPYAFNHWFAYRKEFWKVGGMVRHELWKGLMTRILYYKESTRDLVHAKEVQETFSHHIFKIVSEGYMQIFPIVASLGRVIMVMMYLLYSATKYLIDKPHKGDKFILTVFFAVVPMAAYFYVKLRGRRSSVVRKGVEDACVQLGHFCDTAVDHHRVIADSWARPIALAKCDDLIKKVNSGLVVQGAREANDIAFFGWATELVEAFAIILGGFLVLEGMSLGAFTSTLAGLKSATGQYAVMYQAALKIQSTFPRQWLLCQYINMPTDLDARQDIAATRRDLWQSKLEEAFTDERVQRREQVAEDVVPLQLMEVTFEFPMKMQKRLSTSSVMTMSWSLGANAAEFDATATASVLQKISFSIEQGQLIGITGPPGEGKGTILKVLADVFLPSSGEVFIPPHLLVHHLELQDILYNGSLADNVYFALMARRGIMHVEDLDQSELDRGVAVCQALNMTEDVIEMVRDPFMYTSSNLKGFSKTTKMKVQLARALIANPEVLVVHLPADSFNREQGNVVMQLLQDYVRNKGVHMDSEGFSRRRPRTCVFTSNKETVLNQWADKVFCVAKGKLSEGEWRRLSAGEQPENGRNPDQKRLPDGIWQFAGSDGPWASESPDAERVDRSLAMDALKHRPVDTPISPPTRKIAPPDFCPNFENDEPTESGDIPTHVS